MRLQPHHWGILIATLLLVGALLGYSLVKNGIFPVAFVNGDLIFLHNVQENARITRRLAAENDRILEELALAGEDFDTDEELFVRALESSIINTVIRSRAPESALEDARERVNMYLEQEDQAALRSSIAELYGWDIDTFKERILLPQALDELLAEEYGTDYESWVNEELARARVHIFFVPFDWDGTGVM